MRYTKLTLITSFAMFSLFFGAGNIILPPYLGFSNGDQWGWVTLGFLLTGVIIPILGIYAHAKLQGSMLDFANRISPGFSIVFCTLVYLVAVCLPSPRTASLTHEMAIAPYFDVSSLTTSSVYFGGVFIFVIFRSNILDLMGKVLTPLILTLLFAVIALVVFSPEVFPASLPESSGIFGGILEGYQTFDAMGAIVVGAVIIISLNFKKELEYDMKRKIILRSGILAGIGLCAIYTGLIYSGALLSGILDPDLDRSGILNEMILFALGSKGHILLSILITLACFTTTVGIVAGTADYIKGLSKDSNTAFLLTALAACIIGVAVGQLQVDYIITIAVPVLLLIYPLIITFIILNSLPDHRVKTQTFRMVSYMVILFSLPGALNAMGYPFLSDQLDSLFPWQPAEFTWVVPALLTFLVMQIKKEPARN